MNKKRLELTSSGGSSDRGGSLWDSTASDRTELSSDVHDFVARLPLQEVRDDGFCPLSVPGGHVALDGGPPDDNLLERTKPLFVQSLISGVHHGRERGECLCDVLDVGAEGIGLGGLGGFGRRLFELGGDFFIVSERLVEVGVLVADPAPCNDLGGDLADRLLKVCPQHGGQRRVGRGCLRAHSSVART